MRKMLLIAAIAALFTVGCETTPKPPVDRDPVPAMF